jgi:transketolase
MLEKLSRQARLKIIEKAQLLGGCHIGGSFSLIDFLISYYNKINSSLSQSQKKRFYEGLYPIPQELILSKGHCYISQLAALDTVFKNSAYLESYMKKDSLYFGHPKMQPDNFHFPVSSGSLGQGVTYANGLALGNKLLKNNKLTISIMGDGELNEGSCTEAMLFAVTKKIPHIFILDNNQLMSLDLTKNIFDNGNIKKRMEAYGFKVIEVDGHNSSELNKLVDLIFNLNKNYYEKEMLFVNLKTNKGHGVSFMSKNSIWHHRRFKDDEYDNAVRELKNEK